MTYYVKPSYKDIYEKPSSIEKLLPLINLSLSIKLISIIDYRKEIYESDEVNFLAKNFITKKSTLDKISIFFNKHRQKDSVPTIFNTPSNLYILNILISEYKTDPHRSKTKEKFDTELLFKLYLLINEKFTDKQGVAFKYINTEGITSVRGHLMLGLNYVHNNHNMLRGVFTSEMLKLFIFEKWLSSDFKNLLDSYLAHINMESLEYYFQDLFKINRYYTEYDILPFDIYPELENTLKSLSSNRPNDKPDFMNLRENPLIKLDDGYLVTNRTFLISKFFSGLYFDILNFSKKDFPSFHQKYSQELVEKKLLVEAIKLVFGHSHIQFSEKEILEKGKGIKHLIF